MDLELFAVSASGRVNLGDLLADVKYVQAEKNDDGTITVSPVNIRPATGGTRQADFDNEPLPGI